MWIKRAIALGLGALAGTILALQFFEFHQYLWSLGTILGGCTSYISFDFKEVRKAISDGWKYVVSWEPNKWRWMATGWDSLAGSMLAFWFTVLINVFPILFSPDKQGLFGQTDKVWFSIMFLIVWIMFCIALVFINFLIDNEVKSAEEYALFKRRAKRVFFAINPYTVLFLYPIAIAVIVCRNLPKVRQCFRVILKVTTTVGVAIRGFFKYVFVQIHSEERLLLTAWGTIGGTAGFFTESILIGPLVAIAFGLASHEFISRRILRVVPRTA